MGTLRDEAYEKLDYLSQLTEIVVSPHNEVLGRLPDQLELSFEQIKRAKSRMWGYKPGYELAIHNVLGLLLPDGEYKYVGDLAPHFKLQASEDLELDFNGGTMVGSVRLIKVNAQIEEKELLEMAVTKAQSELHHYAWSPKRLRERVMTILNTLESGRGTAWAQGAEGKTGLLAISEIKKVLNELILENKWRIRDAGTIAKVGEWINSYLKNGDEIGLMNLLKLKIMVDKDLPIYSVDEVKRGNPT